MALFNHYVLTLTGLAQRLTEVLGDSSPGGQDDVSLRVLMLQPGEGNTNPVYLGASGVSATIYAVRLEAPTAGVPPAPFVLGEFESGPMKLQSFYVIGTSGETVHIGIVGF